MLLTAAAALVALVALFLARRPVVVALSLLRRPPEARRYWAAAVWHGWRWRWLARNAGLAYVDQHHRATRPRRPGATSVPVRPDPTHRLRFPAAKIRPDAHGLSADVRLVPNVTRDSFEKSAATLADSWRCHRVQVIQPEPGRLQLRGLRRDPLLEPLVAPPEVFADPEGPLVRVYLGRDEFGTDRWLSLPGLAGMTIGGLPGYGKTMLAHSLLCQLAPRQEVQWTLCDFKGGEELGEWTDRAWRASGDDLASCADALEDTADLMRARLANVRRITGHANGWKRGPTVDWPLHFTIVDECQGAFDLEAVKGDREAEAQVRRCRRSVSELVRKGRSAMMLTALLTQKQTSDAIPTAIRDNCRFGCSFAVRTTEAAVASLGDSIRQHASSSPVALQDPAYVGCMTALLRTGNEPYVRLRVPTLADDFPAEVAAATAHLATDPGELFRPHRAA